MTPKPEAGKLHAVFVCRYDQHGSSLHDEPEFLVICRESELKETLKREAKLAIESISSNEGYVEIFTRARHCFFDKEWQCLEKLSAQHGYPVTPEP